MPALLEEPGHVESMTDSVRCPRCTGLVVGEWTFDMEEHGAAIELLRCVNCGWRDDPVITRHAEYLHRPAETATKIRRKPRPQSMG